MYKKIAFDVVNIFVNFYFCRIFLNKIFLQYFSIPFFLYSTNGGKQSYVAQKNLQTICFTTDKDDWNYNWFFIVFCKHWRSYKIYLFFF